VPYQNVTLSDLKLLVRNRVQNRLFYSDAEITDILNESLRIMQAATGYWKERVVATTVANRVIYDTTAIKDSKGLSILMPLRMSFQLQPMDPTSVFDMDNGMPGWQAQTTATPGMPTTPQLWGPKGLNLFFIWPADAVGNGGLQIDALVQAPALVNDADFLNLDTAAIPPILDYCQHVMSFKRGGAVFRSNAQKLTSFMRFLAQRNSHLRASAEFRAVMGEDSSPRRRPRTTEDAGIKTTVGVR
jgi:hypothetical protein